MTRPRRIALCLLAAAVLGVGLTGVAVPRLQAQAPKKAEPTAVATVNVAFLINQCAKKKAFDADFEKRREKFQRELKER